VRLCATKDMAAKDVKYTPVLPSSVVSLLCERVRSQLTARASSSCFLRPQRINLEDHGDIIALSRDGSVLLLVLPLAARTVRFFSLKVGASSSSSSSSSLFEESTDGQGRQGAGH